MKKFPIFWLIVFILVGCLGQKQLGKVAITDENAAKSDSTEYELIVFDTGFETWFLKHSKPVWFYSQTYFENWNRQYVTAWNAKTMDSRYSRVFDSYIDYRPEVDYGLELNYRLFYYFQYVERGLNIPILSSGMGPRSATQ